MARQVAVIDIGKTNAKVALVDLGKLAEIDVRKTPNAVRKDGLYPHHDVERLWTFILEALTGLNKAHGIDAISITTHGATAALLDKAGELALPLLDYEHSGPDEVREAYQLVRPDFSETGSPSLPFGLNIGLQLYWQSQRFPQAFSKAVTVLMYPQYWGFRLTGQLANEMTSLGCHTDLWNPYKADFSSLVDKAGWRPLFARVKSASAVLGTILPRIAARTGLAANTPVICGIHDSNASLLPHVLANKPPFAVISTGTWVISMAVGGRAFSLDPARDTLVNVNALGDPVPSARFMGGREYEMLGGAALVQPSDQDVASVLTGFTAILPSVLNCSGPFPDRAMQWVGSPATHGERSVAVSFYLALMTATCLGLIGAAGDTIVEGPFAGNELFLDMLAAATGRPVIAQPAQATGTSIGAAMLFQSSWIRYAPMPRRVHADADWIRYAKQWWGALAV